MASQTGHTHTHILQKSHASVGLAPLNMACIILLPESDNLDAFFCDYYLVMVSIQVSPIVMQILYDW